MANAANVVIVVLGEGVTAQAIADECREAALAFLRGAARDWGKRELATWLTDDYVRATRHAPARERIVLPLGKERDPLNTITVSDVLTTAREKVLSAFDDARGMRRALADSMLDSGLVQPALDELGMAAWVPVCVRRCSLANRLMSLLIADYLARPRDYDGEIRLCGLCDGLLLGADARSLGRCSWHRLASGIEVKPGVKGIGETAK
jgi:hypothetical protein